MLEGSSRTRSRCASRCRTSRSAGPASRRRRRHRAARRGRGRRPRLLGRHARPARQARERDLQAAHRQVQLLVDLERPRAGAHGQPYGLFRDREGWYVVGQDLVRKDIRTFKVSRIRGDIRFATRRERDFRIPAEFEIDDHRGRPNWQIGDASGEARIEMAPDTAWWVQREFGDHGRFEDDVFVRRTRLCPCSHRGCSARTAARGRSSLTSFAAWSAQRFARSARCPRASRRACRDEDATRDATQGDRRRPGRRAGALRSAAGAARVSARALRRRAVEPSSRHASSSRTSPHPEDELQDHLRPSLARQFRGRLRRGLRRAAGRRRAGGQELTGTFRAARGYAARAPGDPRGTSSSAR